VSPEDLPRRRRAGHRLSREARRLVQRDGDDLRAAGLVAVAKSGGVAPAPSFRSGASALLADVVLTGLAHGTPVAPHALPCGMQRFAPRSIGRAAISATAARQHGRVPHQHDVDPSVRAPAKSAPEASSTHIFAPRKSVLRKSAPYRSESERSAPLKLAPLTLAP
jgi:hypothetical protein